MRRIKWLLVFALVFFCFTSSYGQQLESGNLFGLHSYELTLLNDVTPEQFEKFYMEEYIPAAENVMQGVKFHLLKGERGQFEGKYGVLIYFKSLEERNYWIPEPRNMSEEGKKAMEKIQPLIDRFYEMVKIESKYTDWIIL
jgi:hypothetical protein